MDEKTQIEEMASIINGSLVSEYYPEPEYIPTATELYNAGYRKQEWISVDERLPDIDELCLLSMENRITKYRWVVIGYYHTNYDEYVTHWMPLPKPPKMKGGAE